MRLAGTIVRLELRFDVEVGLTHSKAGRVTDTDESRREYGLRQ
jgi:hypothetical protein